MFLPSLTSSCGIRVIMVLDHGLPCHEFKLSTTKDPPCRGTLHVKSVESSNVLPLNGSNSLVAQREHRLIRDLRKGPISRIDLSEMSMKFEDTGDLGVLPGRGRIRLELKASKSLLLWWKERPVQSIFQQVVDQCHVSWKFRC
ncbi:hypothetical protein TNCV_1220191 [Trichonephila clavipes]|nr:hypothetical protein TNCV_1220191 [Trichonephila clavipes]